MEASRERRTTIAPPPIAPPPIEGRRSEGKWLFPWVFAVIWGVWLVAVPAYYAWNFYQYEYAVDGRVYLWDGQNFPIGGWRFASMLMAAGFAVTTGIPAIIASVAAYLFLPRGRLR